MNARIFAIVCCLCAVCSCKDVGGDASGVDNPLSECVIPTDACPGEETVIQWNGFSQSASIVLKDKDGKTFPAEVKIVTSSGLIFTVPSGLAPGTYSVALQGQGTFLGQMEILPTDMPVTGLSFPSAIAPGETLEINGNGFDSSFGLYLRNASGQSDLKPEVVAGGIRCVMPADFELGTYRLILTDGKEEWVLHDGFVVAKRKKLVSIRKVTPYEAAVTDCYECRIESEEDEVVAIVYDHKYLDADGQPLETDYEYRYVQVNDWDFQCEKEVSEMLNTRNFKFKYIFDDAGRITHIDALVFSINHPEGEQRLHWCEYDSEGRLTRISYEYKDMVQDRQTYMYENGNLVGTYNDYFFTYGDETLSNHPFAADSACGYEMMMNSLEHPLVFVPYLLGVHTFSSRLLPTGARTVSKFEYVFDTDGYVTQMSWDGGIAKIYFVYE